jgi:hypothetical protein
MKRSACGGRGFTSLTITQRLSGYALRPVHGPIVALTPTESDRVVLDDVLVLT